jgi:uncharacterized membrane protein
MSDFFSRATIHAGFGLLVLCIVIASAFRLMSSFRDYADEDQERACDILANLQEMHLKGDITDEEFRTMKARTHLRSLEDKHRGFPDQSGQSANT